MNDVQQTHPLRNQLIQFSLGKLDSEESAAIEEHIASCDACCQIIRSLPNDTLVDMLQNIGTVSDPGAARGKSHSEPAVQPTILSGNPSNDGLLEIDPHEDAAGGEEAQGMSRASAIADIPEELINHPRYRILGLLGKGGMGNVYRAEHRLMERQVAIKVMNGQLLDRPEAVERFRREVRTAAKLVHPNIVTAFDAEQAGNRHLLVMEYVDGKDLAREVQQSGPMSVEEACLCIRQAALGLEHAHQSGMVHRDIKPQNLIRSGGGAVKILDLGLAHLATETIASGTFAEGPGNLTDLHTMLGTPDYISPEQTEDAHQADIRSDIYSLGATFYYLLTGQPPFSEGSVVDKLAAHAYQAPPELTAFRSDVPEGVVRILQRMMAKNPADRYQTPAELADAIRPWCGDSDPSKILTQQHPASKRTSQPTQRLSQDAPPWRAPRWLKGTLAAATAAAAVVASVLILRTPTGMVQILIDPSVQDEPKDTADSTAMNVATGQQDSEPAKQSEALPADDRADYFTIPLHELPLLDGVLPEPDPTARNIFRFHRLANAIFPYAILDGPGEASIHMERSGWRLSGDVYRNATLAIRVPDEGNPEISGRILLPSPDGNGLVVRKFKINRGTLKSDKQAYLRQQLAYYQELLRRDIPGAAWFRHQVQVAQKALGDTSLISQPDQSQTNRSRESELEQSFALLSGGRAVSENLQLDRLLPATAPEDQMVDMDSIQGITVRQFDWLELVKDLDPELDPLASLVPHDQHAIFFRSFRAMVDLVDSAAVQGTPILQIAEPRGEDAQTQKRYESQLGLPLGTLARSLGPQVIESVALTGADPYLRTGADVAFLFEPKTDAGLMELIQAQVALNAKGYPQATSVLGEVDGVAYTGFCTPDRSLCSYQATIGKTIIVTNSLAQLRRLGTVALGKSPSLASLPEYTFFRDRYRRSGGQETALLVISDPTIRRWCGPRWRIGASRRVQAGAIMTDLVAQHLDQLVRGQIHLPADSNQEKTGQIGSWSLLSTGVHSSIYNTLEFQTPILELDLNRATQAEVSMYNRWREGYQGNWSRFFDPIAVQF
ncbi:MAG: protein kinase, partial [Pirellulales bacterium]|nr:protein kinase [Pirellulales bacterium]